MSQFRLRSTTATPHLRSATSSGALRGADTGSGGTYVVTDDLGLSDSRVGPQNLVKTVVDTTGLVDTASAFEFKSHVANDTLTLNKPSLIWDETTYFFFGSSGANDFAQQEDDDTGLVDALQVAKPVTADDTVGLADSTSTSSAAFTVAVDLVGLSDANSVVSATSFSVTDPLTLNDSFVTSLNTNSTVTVGDSVGLSDVAAGAVLAGTTTDVVVLTDSTSRVAFSGNNPTDDAGLGDDVAAVIVSGTLPHDLAYIADDDTGMFDWVETDATTIHAGLFTVGARIAGGTVTAAVHATTATGNAITTGGTMTGGTTTGGTTTGGTPGGVPVPVGAADYQVHHGYCKVGLYPGFIIGTGGTGDLLTALTAFETLAGQKIEAFSRGLPNNMGDPTNSLLQAQGCPQLGVWATPLVPMGTGSIALGLTGAYDALIDATADAMIAHRPKDVLRLGWEFNGNNYNWGLGHIDPHTGLPNTLADIIAMQRRFIDRARARGFTGYFDLNGGTGDTSKPPVEQWWAGDSYGDIIGWDMYASQSGSYPQSDMIDIWNHELLPQLNHLVAFARAHNKYIGMGECGIIAEPSNPFRAGDNQLYWQLLTEYAKANSDVFLYLCLWNQNLADASFNVTQEGAIAFSGSIAGQVTGNLHNTSTHGPWQWTPSPNLQQSLLGWRKYMKTGSMTNGSVVTGGGAETVTVGGTTAGGTTTGGVTKLPNGMTVTGATVTGGTSVGGTLVGGTPNASGQLVGGTLTGGILTGGTLTGGLYSIGGYTGGTLQSDGTLVGGTLVGGTSTGGTATGGVTQLSDGSVVVGGTINGGTTVGGTTTGGVFDPLTGVVTGGTTVGGVTTGGTLVPGTGTTVPPGSGPVPIPGGYVPPGNVGAAVPVPGVIGWNYTGDTPDGFKLIAFTSGSAPLVVSYDVPYQGAGRQFFQTNIGDVSQYGWVVYPYKGTAIGQGALYTEGWFLNPPTTGVKPGVPSPPAPPGSVVTSGTTTTVISQTLQEVAVTYSNNSNFWYVGGGENVAVFGHTPAMALDENALSYWMSIGNGSPTADNAYEWFEVSLANQPVSTVHIHDVKGGYFLYVSVFANGAWVNHGTIPYANADPTSHNGGNIPYAETLSTGGSEGPFVVTLRTPQTGVTKVRITFHQLQDFSAEISGDPLVYRAGLRKVRVFGLQSSTTSTTATGPALSPIHDNDTVDVLKSTTTYTPPAAVAGAGHAPGSYEDYSDLIKLFCAWAGFFWPQGATTIESSGNIVHYDFGTQVGLPNVDPVLGQADGGRVWGNIDNTGVAGIANLPIPQWDKKSLLDCISYVRDIIGFLFMVDEVGGVIWRLPNVFQVGNYFASLAATNGRTNVVITIDESQTLMDLKATMSSRNVRERYFVASTDGKTGALSAGFNANPIGLRRVAGWTDQHFGTDAECQLMADMIALRALMSYRVDTIQIPGYPRIQVDDQIRINEKITAEGFLHYVRGISSSNDLESGLWTYDLNTSWLGLDPFTNWVFNATALSAELQAYLATSGPGGSGGGTTGGPGTITKDVSRVAKLVKAVGTTAVYITDGITKRHVVDADDQAALVNHGLVPSNTVEPVQVAFLAAIPDAP